MKHPQISATKIISIGLLAASCASPLPSELTNARAAYDRASHGPASKSTPAEVHVAYVALSNAERSFQKDGDSFQTRDLAYVAQRRAELAEAAASIHEAKKKQESSQADFEKAQGQLVATAKQDLVQAKSDLALSQQSEVQGEQNLATEKNARLDAERRAAAAQLALAKLASVREEPRGTVITLSGSVLFASDQSTLLPEARARLDEVAEVLLSTRERNVTVEGHTDSRGSDGHNLDLSQRRADAVRSYLVQKAYEPDRITARGYGEAQPVAANSDAEGRANNRRVEIVISPSQVSARP